MNFLPPMTDLELNFYFNSSFIERILMHFLMIFYLIQFKLDGQPGNGYFRTFQKISDLLKPLGLRPQGFGTD